MNHGSRTARLLADTRAEVEAAADARLIREMTEGSVDGTAYARYLHAEEDFVRTSARTLGAAVFGAPTWEAALGHARSLQALVTEQTDYFARARATWPVAAELGPRGLERARGLSEIVLAAAASGGYPAVVSAMFAAEHLYLTWCTAAVRLDVSRPKPIQDWIELHTRVPFTDQVAFLGSEVDALPDDVEDTRVREWFVSVLREERVFHDAAYEED